MTRIAVSLLLAAAIGGWPVAARAYGEAEKFAAPAIEGGGGGRWFTGSIRDGYTCEVCHTGGEAPGVEIDGLPEDGYLPGEIYDLVLTLPDGGAVSAAVVELAVAEGGRAGRMAMPATVGADEECEPGTAAGHHQALPGGREVVAMDACGARRLRVTWTAPAEPRGPVWFHAAVVAGDASGTPDGDGVHVHSRVIPLSGNSATSAEVGSTCAASPSPRTHPRHLAWLLLPLLLRLRRSDPG